MEKGRKKWKELFGIDVRSLALFRMGLALVAIGDLLIRLQDLKAHYSDEGIMPRDFLIGILHPWDLSLNMISGTWQIQLLLFILTGLSAFFLLIGYKARLACILTWTFVISLQLRNPMINQGGDIVLRVLLFWAMFLPLGARWSLDQLLDDKEPVANQVFSVGTCALLLQICFIYWFSSLLKTDPTWTEDGTAVWYALSIEQYSTALGIFLLQYPQLLKVFTFATLYLEKLGPFFAFSPFFTGPLRFATAVSFMLFHLIGLNLTMELALFPYICFIAWIAFIPAWFWDHVLKANHNSLKAWKASFFSNILAIVSLIYIFLWNIFTLGVSWPYIHPLPESIGYLFAIDQTWDMFAPTPIKLDGWYVIPGLLRDGTEVDLFKNGAPISWEKPASLSATYPNDRWRSYMMNLLLKEDGNSYFPYYANYLCREWNENHPFEQQLLSFDIFFMMRINSFSHPHSDYEKKFIWHQECFY